MSFVGSSKKNTDIRKSQNILLLLRKRALFGRPIRSHSISIEKKIPNPSQKALQLNLCSYCSQVLTNFGLVIYKSDNNSLQFITLNNKLKKTIPLTRQGTLLKLPIECPFTVLLFKEIPIKVDVYDTTTGSLLNTFSGIIPLENKEKSVFFLQGFLCFIKLKGRTPFLNYYKKTSQNQIELVHKKSILGSEERKIQRVLISKTHAVFFSLPLPCLTGPVRFQRLSSWRIHTINLLNQKSSFKDFDYEKNFDRVFLSKSILCHHSRQKETLRIFDVEKQTCLKKIHSSFFTQSELLSFENDTAFFSLQKKHFLFSCSTLKLKKLRYDPNIFMLLIDPDHALIYKPQEYTLFFQEISSKKETPILCDCTGITNFDLNHMEFCLLKGNRFAFTDSKNIFLYEAKKTIFTKQLNNL